MKFLDITGRRFGMLDVIGRDFTKKGKDPVWLCKCDCGASKFVTTNNLVSGRQVSCGCFGKTQHIKHGKAGSHVYAVWSAMHTRCTSQNHIQHKDYAGRGIAVCDRWDSFDQFYADMGEPPKGFTLERIDNDKGYSPDNCKWASRSDQAFNKRSNHLLTFSGKTQSLTAWAVEKGMPASALSSRINTYKWSVEDALTIPLASKRQPKGLNIKLITFNGVSKSMPEWAKHIGISKAALYKRLKRFEGDLNKALTHPAPKHAKGHIEEAA